MLFVHARKVLRFWFDTVIMEIYKELTLEGGLKIKFCIKITFFFWVDSDRFQASITQFCPYVRCKMMFKKMHVISTFTGGEVEVKIDDVGAAAVAGRRAKLLSEARLEERVG